MATTDSLTDTHAGHGAHAGHDHGHDHHGHDHDHPPFLAHHFDTPEQQFDSGKLGMWLFLVTEILFFSGLFCAYAIFRSLNPEVFVGCSEFLNTKLGAINTGVLLFSSLTMAWAVRCAQTEEYEKLTAMLAATLSCAMIFLGVKSIEYSHKWELGLLPPALYFYNPENPHPEGISKYLIYLVTPFAIGLIGLIVWFVKSQASGNKFHAAIAKPMIVVFLSFFVGVGLGMILESGESHDSGHHAGADHGDAALAAVGADHGDAAHADADHAADKAHADADHAASHAKVAAALSGDEPVLRKLAQDETNSGIRGELEAIEHQAMAAGVGVIGSTGEKSSPIEEIKQETNTRSRAGVFFGIYYVMTGIHAIHILAGIGVLTWLLVRSVRRDFNRQYFGPVDYVGLYWHIVDLIWIYLFPLLYLIR
jgi:cytochrome c oxidase subunit 3